MTYAIYTRTLTAALVLGLAAGGAHAFDLGGPSLGGPDLPSGVEEAAGMPEPEPSAEPETEDEDGEPEAIPLGPDRGDALDILERLEHDSAGRAEDGPRVHPIGGRDPADWFDILERLRPRAPERVEDDGGHSARSPRPNRQVVISQAAAGCGEIGGARLVVRGWRFACLDHSGHTIAETR